MTKIGFIYPINARLRPKGGDNGTKEAPTTGNSVGARGRRGQQTFLEIFGLDLGSRIPSSKSFTRLALKSLDLTLAN